jgi:hypothetical protein
MEARVRRLALVLGALASSSPTAGCDRTPPQDLLRIADSGASLWANPTRDAGPPWVSSFCKPLPEPEVPASFSDLTFSGECPVHVSLPVKCLAQGDDFYVAATRPLEGGRSLELFLNVESFSGAGEYERKVEVRVIVKDKATLYQWVHYQASASLGTSERAGATGSFHTSKAAPVTFLVLPPVSLYAAPGTPTSGFIELEGTMGCAPPGSGTALEVPGP